MKMVREILTRVSADENGQNVESEEKIRQSTENRRIAQHLADENVMNNECDKQWNSSDAPNTNSNCTIHNYQSENEDGQFLLPAPVYQRTTENVNKEKHLLASTLGSVASLKSIGKMVGVNCRTILWYVTFVGFMVNYMYRININIAIVEMVARKPATANHQTSECIIAETLNSTAVRIKDASAVNTTTFAWNELDQSRVLGSFFWLHWAPQVLGGVLAPRYGAKLIFGFSNFISCFLCFIIPMLAKWHVNYLVALRIVQGIVSGVAWPAMHHLTSQWIPPNERSQFLTSYQGGSIGIALFYPLFGFIISVWSWESIFYFSGIFGSVWYAAWLYFVYDSPENHPRIDPAERIYIQESLGDSIHTGKKKTPWKSILCSWPVWVNIIGQFGGIWGLFTMMTQAPTYFRLIHGWNVQMTGLLSGIPHLCRMIFAYIFSIFIDSLLRNEKLSRTNVRKLAGGVANIVHGLFVVGLAYSGCNSTLAVVYLTLATSVHGAVSSAQLPSLIEISPNFSGVTLGLNGLIGIWPGFISPYIVGKLTFGNQTIQQWQYVFFICAAVLFVTGFIYVLCADSTLQSWNQPKVSSKSIKDEELKVLNGFYESDPAPLKDAYEISYKV